jgi:hypothetical protein
VQIVRPVAEEEDDVYMILGQKGTYVDYSADPTDPSDPTDPADCIKLTAPTDPATEIDPTDHPS